MLALVFQDDTINFTEAASRTILEDLGNAGFVGDEC